MRTAGLVIIGMVAPFLITTATSGTVSLGTIPVRGGSAAREFDSAAVSYSRTNPEVDGKVENKTNGSRSDITFKIVKKGTGGGTDLPNITGGTIGGKVFSFPKSHGSTRTVSLGGRGQPAAFQDGGKQEFTLELSPTGQNPPSTFEVQVTLGTRSGGSAMGADHFDVTRQLDFTATATNLDTSVDAIGNKGFMTRVRNAGATESEANAITQLSGTVKFPSGSGLTVSAAYVTATDGTTILAQHTPSTPGQAFSFSDLKIQDGATVLVWVRFSDIPAGLTTIKLGATYGGN